MDAAFSPQKTPVLLLPRPSATAAPQVGLDVWLRDGKVFTCWSSMWDVIWHGELGSSLALLNAGGCAWVAGQGWMLGGL
jgi:hypothetical protein